MTTATDNAMCSHRMPCGWCDLKNKICDRDPQRYPNVFEDDQWPKIDRLNMVSVYAAPSGAPITTLNGVSYDKT